MQAQMLAIVQKGYADLANGSSAETLANIISDRMHDSSAEYRAMPYKEQRAITLQFAQQYV